LRLIWSPKALFRAAEIVDFIAAERPQAALEWIDGLQERVESLAELPQQGRAVPEWYELSVRELIYSGHRIIYEVAAEYVRILTIRHQRQRLGAPDFDEDSF